jgi:hemoglobin
MKRDIETQEDVKQMVRGFYDKVLKDHTLNPFFTKALSGHWEQHLQLMDSFWSNILFYTGGYMGNPMKVHLKLHTQVPFSGDHFKQWLTLFNENLDELFAGEKAELAKQRAASIATNMKLKIVYPSAKVHSLVD